VDAGLFQFRSERARRIVGFSEAARKAIHDADSFLPIENVDYLKTTLPDIWSARGALPRWYPFLRFLVMLLC